MSKTIYTIGHSTRRTDELLEMLNNNSVKTLVDVRHYPRSRTNPQFNSDELGRELEADGIHYIHMEQLGGRRRAKRDSMNTVWEHPAFRGYADYMETEEFDQALNVLIGLAKKSRVAIMCSEAVWWRCHRSMISDALVARGFNVEHIMSPSSNQPHKLRPFAHVENEHVVYRSG